MRTSRVMGRAIGLAAVVIAAVAVVVILLGSSGSDYTVQARFQNASQIVKGNLVQVAGNSVGEVTDIDLTRDGQAELTLAIEDDYAPLRRGTLATVRQSSLSGVANRYIDLRLAPDDNEEIEDGGVIAQSDTTTAVDLDQIFNIFGPEERKALSGVIRGYATAYGARGEETNRGFLYLNPSLAATSRLFRELNRDTPLLNRFVKESSSLVTDLADRRDDLAGLVSNLADTTGAIAREKGALGEALANLPGFMRQTNTTFVNLRSTLDDFDPLVAESKPVAKKLRPFLNELRPLARDARPTLRDLSTLVRDKGKGNDLIELTRSTLPLRDIAVRPVERNGKTREGALPASVKAIEGSTRPVQFFRPYTVDLTGWFNDFGTSGVYDALGTASRAAPHVSAFSVLNGVLQPVLPGEARTQIFESVATLNQNNRCPGAAERPNADKSNLFLDPAVTQGEGACDPTEIPSGE